MSEWKDITTAPKDGTVIRVKNESMDHPVKAKWGKYFSRVTGKTYDEFVLVEDETDFMPLPAGTLVIPTLWQPAQ